jgi:2-iminobutanoate/2-iminopropanoate deaminase
MTKRIIRPAGVHRTTGYSHAVMKSGTPVFIAGQVAQDIDGKLVGAGDIEAQVAQVFANLKAVVTGCGGTMEDIVKLTVFTTDLKFRPAIAEFLVVQSLATPHLLVEIEAVAVIEE